MQAGLLLEGQQIMDGPVALDAAHSLELGTDQNDAEVGFALGSGPGMAGMSMGLVDDLEMGRGQGLTQNVVDALSACHGLNVGKISRYFKP